MADSLQVAVASNFRAPLQALAERFNQESGSDVRISSGSTGKLYAQIVHGAPYDLFLAADSRRPELLEKAGLAVAGSRFTYAVGRLALWSMDPALIGDNAKVLGSGAYKRLAVANPKTAPYGRAALEVLARLDLLQQARPRLVFGENVGQAFQFVFSGNAKLGLVALAQIDNARFRQRGSRFLIPGSWHQPIRQQAVVLAKGQTPLALDFAAFMNSPAGQSIIVGFGYDLESTP